MKIRSITYFCNPAWPLDEQCLRSAGSFLASARLAYRTGGYEVQTTRLATIPFPQLLADRASREAIDLAVALEDITRSMGIDYVSIGPALVDGMDRYAILPDVIKATQNIFVSGMLTASNTGISLPALRACAKVIEQSATISPDGFANLRFAALANVPPGSPFFPAAYHSGDQPSFALATEAADLAVIAFTDATSLGEARQNLIEMIEVHAKHLVSVGEALSAQFRISFGGIDFSLAPFPQESLSLATAIERLGVPAVGGHGSLAVAAFIADALDRANFPRVGFSGLMLPVLEDATLARRAAEGILTIKDLLLYSAVCGTGLDTIPLPGDTSQEQIAAILLDVAALALRLGKPLTARLIPIPGKAAGDATNFNFAYFANSRVMEVCAAPLKGVLTGDESIFLARRERTELPVPHYSS